MSRVSRNLWVPFATIQLKGMASIWWSKLGVDSHTTSWSSFTNVPWDAFGVPPDPHVPEFDLKEDPEEDLEEDPVEEDEGSRLMKD